MLQFFRYILLTIFTLQQLSLGSAYAALPADFHHPNFTSAFTKNPALTSDIIWMVEAEIDGKNVLVPVVYLAQATLDGLAGNTAVISAGNNISIAGADGVVVQYRESGNLNDSVAQLARAPELAWMAQLQNDPNVDWHAVEEAYRTWNHKSTTLTPAASVVIAIAIAAATSGAGASIAGSVSGFVSGGAAVGSTAATLGAAAGAAAQGAFMALVSQAGVSVINNQGDIGKVFKELSSSAAIRNIAIAALTAGTTEGIITDYGITDGMAKSAINASTSATVYSIVTGADFDEALINSLKFAAADIAGAHLAERIGGWYGTTFIDENGKVDLNYDTKQIAQSVIHKIAHGAVGCATGAIAGSCIGGAVGAITAETMMELLSHDELRLLVNNPNMSQIEFDATLKKIMEDNALTARLTAVGAGFLVSDGEAAPVTAANQAASTAIENNAIQLIAGTIAVGMAAWTAYDVYDAYNSAPTPEEGAVAALKVLAIDGAITIVTFGVGTVGYKVGGKLFTSASEAFNAWKSGDSVVAKIVNAGADSAANALNLSKKLASEAQMKEAGTIIAGKGSKETFRGAEEAARKYGGNAEDWVKKSSSSHKTSDGLELQTHWVENLKTGQRVEFKTKIGE